MRLLLSTRCWRRRRAALRRLAACACACGGGGGSGGGVGQVRPAGSWVVPIDVAQVAARLNDIADASFEFFGFGETAVCFAVPDLGGGGSGGGGGRRRRRRWRRKRGFFLVSGDLYDKGSSC